MLNTMVRINTFVQSQHLPHLSAAAGKLHEVTRKSEAANPLLGYWPNGEMYRVDICFSARNA